MGQRKSSKVTRKPKANSKMEFVSVVDEGHESRHSGTLCSSRTRSLVHYGDLWLEPFGLQIHYDQLTAHKKTQAEKPAFHVYLGQWSLRTSCPSWLVGRLRLPRLIAAQLVLCLR